MHCTPAILTGILTPAHTPACSYLLPLPMSVRLGKQACQPLPGSLYSKRPACILASLPLLSFSCQHPVQYIRKRFHRIFYFHHRIRLRPCLEQNSFGSKMKIIPKTRKVNSPIQIRVILLCLILQLERKRQVILDIRIRQIVNRTVVHRVAQPVVTHNLGRGFSIDLCHQMPIFRDSIPVQINNYFNRRILLQYLFYFCPGKIISLISV